MVALTVPASIVPVALKLVKPVRLVILAVVALIVLEVMLPVAVMFWIFARFVIVPCVPSFKVAPVSYTHLTLPTILLV